MTRRWRSWRLKLTKRLLINPGPAGVFLLGNAMREIYELTQLDGKSLQERTLKLSEEAGELAQAVLTVTKAPGSTYKNHSLADVREEAADAAIVALSILAQTCSSEAEFSAELDRLIGAKCAKWKSVLSQD